MAANVAKAVEAEDIGVPGAGANKNLSIPHGGGRAADGFAHQVRSGMPRRSQVPVVPPVLFITTLYLQRLLVCATDAWRTRRPSARVIFGLSCARVLPPVPR